MELLADVPHAWPAGLLAERKQAIRECLDRHGLAISNVNAFMMNAVADPRQPYWHPSWIEPDRHYRAIRREHTKRALRLAKELGARRSRPSRAGRWRRASRGRPPPKCSTTRSCPALKLAEKLEVFLLIEPEPGLMIETLRAVSGVRRPHRLALGRAELRHRPCLLRRRGPAGLDRPHGAAHEALPPRRHRRHARAPAH